MPAGPWRDHCVALTYRAPERRAAADEALARLEALANAPVIDAELAIAIAEAHAFRGDTAAALKWADRALLSTDPRKARLWTRKEMILSPFLRVLHSDARWSTLIASADAP